MLFQLYSSHAVMQLIGWVLVFCGLIIMNEIGRRTRTGGMIVFVIIAVIIKRAKAMGKNPYSNEVFKGTKDFEEAMARAEA